MLKLALIGAVLVSITVAIHALGTAFLVRYLANTFLDRTGHWGPQRVLTALMLAALVLVFLHALEIIVWAGAYMAIVPAGELADFEAAVYFSFVTFTTLGYGDMTLSEGFRLLSGIQALNGILLVGWSTALMFAVVQKTWEKDVEQDVAQANPAMRK